MELTKCHAKRSNSTHNTWSGNSIGRILTQSISIFFSFLLSRMKVNHTYSYFYACVSITLDFQDSMIIQFKNSSGLHLDFLFICSVTIQCFYSHTATHRKQYNWIIQFECTFNESILFEKPRSNTNSALLSHIIEVPDIQCGNMSDRSICFFVAHVRFDFFGAHSRSSRTTFAYTIIMNIIQNAIMKCVWMSQIHQNLH